MIDKYLDTNEIPAGKKLAIAYIWKAIAGTLFTAAIFLMFLDKHFQEYAFFLAGGVIVFLIVVFGIVIASIAQGVDPITGKPDKLSPKS